MNYSPIEEVALTQKLVRIESTNPGAFEYKVSDFVYDFLVQTGADVLRHEVKDGRCNIVATLKGEQSGPRLVYICHQDTVPLGDGWHHDPLAAEIIDGRMYGRGSCDMKSGLAAGMLAFRNIAAMGKKRKHDFLFIASMDEEDIMIGADKLIADGIVRADDYVLDAEPTNGAIKVAHKGKTWFRLDAKGVAYDVRDIKLDNPTAEELRSWHQRSGLPLKRFFNTSGQLYRAMELTKKLPELSEDEQYRLLATDGMLVKRPLLVAEEFVLVGFREAEWDKKLG